MPPRYLTGVMLGALASLVVSDFSRTHSVSALSADAQAGPTAQTGRSGQEPLASIAQAALRVGSEIRFPKGFCRFIDFNSGNDECPFQMLLLEAEGQKHLFSVYRSPDETIILLALRTADEADFYRTTTRGDLVKAVHAGRNGTLAELPDSRAVSQKFDREVGFWRSKEGQFK